LKRSDSISAIVSERRPAPNPSPNIGWLLERKLRAVHISKTLSTAIDEFLDTEIAAKIGFDSRADDVTATAKVLLMEYGFTRITLFKNIFRG
jgi:hypothetical protein